MRSHLALVAAFKTKSRSRTASPQAEEPQNFAKGAKICATRQSHSRLLVVPCQKRSGLARNDNERSGFVRGFGVDGDAVDLREALLDAVFDRGGDIVNLGDGKIAVHGAVAGDEDFVFDAAHVRFVAVNKFVKFGRETVDEIADVSGEFFHFFSARNVRAERLDMDND